MIVVAGIVHGGVFVEFHVPPADVQALDMDAVSVALDTQNEPFQYWPDVQFCDGVVFVFGIVHGGVFVEFHVPPADVQALPISVVVVVGFVTQDEPFQYWSDPQLVVVLGIWHIDPFHVPPADEQALDIAAVSIIMPPSCALESPNVSAITSAATESIPPTPR